MSDSVECPHLTSHAIRIPSVIHGPFSCSVCRTHSSPWFCLHCSGVHCGRYINAHAKDHGERQDHPLAIDCVTLATYCYVCDDYVTNQHRLPSSIFQRLNAALGSGRRHRPLIPVEYDETSNSSSGLSTPDKSSILQSHNCSSSSSSPLRRRRSCRSACKTSLAQLNGSSSANDSSTIRKRVGEDETTTDLSDSDTSISNTDSSLPPSLSTDLNSQNGYNPLLTKKRRLVPNIHDSQTSIQKRAKENFSTDGLGNSGNKNGVKHGVVGLRNLGNTCFMNAVLQSLSKIREFSRYIADIPPPDQLLLTQNEQSVTINESPPRRIYSTRSQRHRLLAASQNTLRSESEQEQLIRKSTEAMAILRTEDLLTIELRNILILLNTKGSSAVSPDSLFSIIWDVMPRFRGYQQQDAHEFLRYMLDQLHNELIRLIPTFSWNDQALNSSKSNGENLLKSLGSKTFKNGHISETFLSVFGYNSIVTSMFGGILENEVRCNRCGTQSRKNDPFLDLSLDIPNRNVNEPRLEDCLSNFTDVEELSEDDKYFCSHCKAHQKSTKRFCITRLPNVLCLHLKRFRWSNYLRTKLDHYVQFPMTSLDMTEYLLEKLQKRGSTSSHLYDLAAVIVHHGSGVGSGHYTAFAKNDGHWYHFNDSNVRPSEESAVAKCKAYILFYTRPELKIL